MCHFILSLLLQSMFFFINGIFMDNMLYASHKYRVYNMLPQNLVAIYFIMFWLSLYCELFWSKALKATVAKRPTATVQTIALRTSTRLRYQWRIYPASNWNRWCRVPTTQERVTSLPWRLSIVSMIHNSWKLWHPWKTSSTVMNHCDTWSTVELWIKSLPSSTLYWMDSETLLW